MIVLCTDKNHHISLNRKIPGSQGLGGNKDWVEGLYLWGTVRDAGDGKRQKVSPCLKGSPFFQVNETYSQERYVTDAVGKSGHQRSLSAPD